MSLKVSKNFGTLITLEPLIELLNCGATSSVNVLCASALTFGSLEDNSFNGIAESNIIFPIEDNTGCSLFTLSENAPLLPSINVFPIGSPFIILLPVPI